MNYETNVDVNIDLNDLAYGISRDESLTTNNYEGIHEFVLAIDDHVCDLQFTIALRDKLTEVIDQESE